MLWLGIDMGPEGGNRGGEIIASGTPEEIAQNVNSYTGQYLKKVLQNNWSNFIGFNDFIAESP